MFQLLLETQHDVHILLIWLLCHCVMCILSATQHQGKGSTSQTSLYAACHDGTTKVSQLVTIVG
jgi:hypothetical protein